MHLIQPPNDSWLRIFTDSLVCSLMISAAAAMSGCVMQGLSRCNVPNLAAIYIPCFAFCCLPSAFYGRYRSRVAFSAADIMWSLPTFFSLGLALDLLDNSIWVPLIASIVMVASMYLRSMLNASGLVREN